MAPVPLTTSPALQGGAGRARRHWAGTLLAACLLAASAAPALAQTAPAMPPDSALQVPQRDPWVPPAVRAAAQATPVAPRASGAALRAQVEARLRARFEAADASRSGHLSAEQARAAGLVWLADRFEQVDTRRAGRVSFDDVQRYLRASDAAR